MNWTQVQSLVPDTGKSPDFELCLEAFPQLRLAEKTEQSPRWHAEGNCWIHTKMVIEALLGSAEYARLVRAEQEIVFLAALLHDVAKYSTSTIDEITGSIGHPGHSKMGAVDARIALWEADTPFLVREAICRLIASHQLPFHALEISRRGKSPEFIVRELSWDVDLRLLALLAEADMRGRICEDQQKVLDSIELFRILATEDGCYGQPRPFADPHTAVSYFRGANVHPDYSLHQEPGSRVVVMSGLPASGKNRWVETNHPDLQVISFDDAREDLGLRHGKNEGAVAHHAVDQAKEMLRARKPFVWNATHLSAQMRAKTVDLCFAYNAEVEIVYLEAPRAELLRRNTQRDTSLSNKGLLGMLHRWEIPSKTEAHMVMHLAT